MPAGTDFAITTLGCAMPSSKQLKPSREPGGRPMIKRSNA